MAYKVLNKIEKPEDIKAFSSTKIKRLASEMRDYILNVCAENGGHLASNLGMVELSIALHRVFDSPKDKIIFDVSHQAYAHKLLTGRYEEFKTLRQFGGLSGFTKIAESEHDIFGAGHASTSLSAAQGLAKAAEIKGEQREVVAIIGDGALSGGMAFEALNNIGHDQTRVIIILNDNDMSIDKNVGSLTNYLTKMRTAPNYAKAKFEAHKYIEKIPAVGMPVTHAISKLKDSIKQIVIPGMLFEEMGITYIGVVDGHNIKDLEETLEAVKQLKGPVLIHISTVKGKGYFPAEQSPEKYHGVSAFDIANPQAEKAKKATTFSQVCGNSLVEMADKDDRVVAITAAMPSGTGLNQFAQRFPERFFDVGIAEAHAVTFAAGLARAGMKPFFAVYSTFLQRAYDQLIHDVCIQKLPVTFCVDRAGLVGHDGETHHGVFDLSYGLSIPNLSVMAPKNGAELQLMLSEALNYEKPLLIRYPRGSAYQVDGKATLASEKIGFGDDFLIVVVGDMYYLAKEALELLNNENIKGSLLQIKQLKPLADDIDEIIVEAEHIFSLENNTIIGGFGSYLSLHYPHKTMISLGIEDQFVTHGDCGELFKSLALDAPALAARIKAEISG